MNMAAIDMLRGGGEWTDVTTARGRQSISRAVKDF
jgi:hypothetical protein